MKRNGTVYLLESDYGIYKLGRTSVSIDNRVNSAKRKYGIGFYVIATRESKDCISLEKHILWSLMNKVDYPGKGVEFFTLGMIEKQDVLNIFWSCDEKLWVR